MRSRFTTSAVGSTSSSVVRHRDSELLKVARHQRARPDERDARAHFQEREDVRPRDPAEKNVADNRDMEIRQSRLSFPESYRGRASPESDVRARRRRH